MRDFDVIIVGAGAAGLMCAIRAGQRGRRVLVLDHAEQAGSKILISGGGRCNFTNTRTAPDRFFSENKHFCKSALNRYTPQDFIELIKKHAIAYHEKTLGQLFCDVSAKLIVQMLLDECKAVHVEIRLQHRTSSIQKSDIFHVVTDHGEFSAPSLVLATGGLSIPKMGASNFTHSIAQQFGMALTETRPALVPLIFGVDDLALAHALSGVSLETEVSCGKSLFRENILFTHRGLSGPAILQVSSCWREQQPIIINLLPDILAADFLLERKRTRSKAEVKTILTEVLPQSLARQWVTPACSGKPIGAVPDKDLLSLSKRLNAWQVMPIGTEGYSKAEVTLGGVDTRCLSSKTMQANDVPGLFIIGEAVDVTGWLGGYNFQWAWASGWCAGEAV